MYSIDVLPAKSRFQIKLPEVKLKIKSQSDQVHTVFHWKWIQRSSLYWDEDSTEHQLRPKYHLEEGNGAPLKVLQGR
jgi:hypothetical protein